MENKKDFKILCVGEGGEGKKKIEYNPIYLYSQNLNSIRPFDEAYREINEKAFEEIKECRFVKHMRHHLMLKGFIAILLFFCC